MVFSERQYIEFDPGLGYPTGENVYYECLNCKMSIPSIPKVSLGCLCKNILIDLEYGRLSIKDHEKFEAYKLV